MLNQGLFPFWYHVIDTPHFSCMQACFLRISAPVLRPLWSPPPPPGSVAPIVRMSGTALLAARDLNKGHPTPSTLLHPRSNSLTRPEVFFIKVTLCPYDGNPNLYIKPPTLSHTHTHTLIKANAMSFPGLLKSSCWESSWSADCALPPSISEQN